MNKYILYVADCETTGLDPIKHDVIELSVYRLLDDQQKTWCIKPTNLETIDLGALRVNKHKIEDLRWETKIGRDTYHDAAEVLIEIENWIAEDNVAAAQRVLVGANTGFDKGMLDQLWTKCNSAESFPFGRRYLDIQQIEFFLNMCQGDMLESYSLANIIKKYGIKNDKSHTAASDTLATKEVLEKQVEFFKKVLVRGL